MDSYSTQPALSMTARKQATAAGGSADVSVVDRRSALRGLLCDAITERRAIERITASLERGEGGWVLTPNLDILRRYKNDRSFRELVSETNLRLVDGMPLVWASRLAGVPVPERVPGSSLVISLAEALAAEGRSLYLLGGEAGAAEGAAAELVERFPGLRVCGTHCPPMGFETDPSAMAEIERRLGEAEPDVVYVALGSPKQERLIASLRERHPRAWWLGVGVSLSFLSGQLKRAPRWMQRCGLEWAHRLRNEPRRLYRRYLRQGLPFAAMLGLWAVRERVRRMWRNRG